MKITKRQLRKIIKEALGSTLINNHSQTYKTTDLSAIKNTDLTRMLGDNNVAFAELTGAVLEDFDLWDEEEYSAVADIAGTKELFAINRDIRVALKDKPDRKPGTNIYGY